VSLRRHFFIVAEPAGTNCSQTFFLFGDTRRRYLSAFIFCSITPT
jgi:hypothetical protein